MSLTFKTAMNLCFPFLAALNSWGRFMGREANAYSTMSKLRERPQ
jgi:hypothetical protein